MGPGSPHYRTGRHSKFLPSRMAAAYQDALEDPRLLELRDEIATVDARLADLLGRVDTGEAGAIWSQARDAFAKFRLEQARENIIGMQAALGDAERLITRGAGDYAAWDEIQKLIDQRRKLCDSENRRLQSAHETLTADRAMALLAVVVSIVQKHVTDKRILSDISAEIQGLVLARQGDGSYAQPA